MPSEHFYANLKARISFLNVPVRRLRASGTADALRGGADGS